MDYSYGIQYTIINQDPESDQPEEITFNLPAEPEKTLEVAFELLDQYDEFFREYGEEGVNWKNLIVVQCPKIVWTPYTGPLNRPAKKG